MLQTQDNELKVAEINQQDLIKGEFSPEEASEIINHMISKKINFHELKNFSSEIRFGSIDKNSKERIEQLKACKSSLNETLQEAKKLGKPLRITSSISVEIIH
jgi:ABC-type Fe3+ transport system substrate-binding protein